MSAAEACEVVERALSQKRSSQIIVSTRPLSGLPEDHEGRAVAERLGLGRRRAGSGVEAAAPDLDTAQRMGVIWAKAFGLGHIDPMQNFFGLGGESLLALQILDSVREAFGVELSLRDFFANPSVLALSECLQKVRSERPTAAEPALVSVPRQARRWPSLEAEPGSALDGALASEPSEPEER
jgi:acyl carrier protein